MRLRHLRITAVMRLLRIVTMMAVRTIGHVRTDISLVVVQIDGSRFRVIRRVVTVVIRRRPNGITRMTEDIPQRRTFNEDRTNDVVISVQVRITDHLYEQRIRLTLCHQGSYVLEHSRSQASLDKEGVVIATMRLDHAQVVNPTVAVQIEVIDHVPAGVEDLLELTYRTAVCEGSSHGIEVEVEARIGVVVRYDEGCHRSYLRRRGRYLRRIDRLSRNNRFRGWHFGIDPSNPTTRHAKSYES